MVGLLFKALIIVVTINQGVLLPWFRKYRIIPKQYQPFKVEKSKAKSFNGHSSAFCFFH